MRWLGVKSEGSAIPTTLGLLRLVYVGRMCLAIAIYITTALKVRVAAPLDILVTSLMLVTAAAVTAASYWHTHFRRRRPGPTFLYLQALFDVFLITAEVRQVQLEADDVLRNIRTGVITVDADGHLLYANPASEEILGFKAREWLGKTVMPEFARLAPEFWAAVTSTARRGVRLMRVEATVHRPDHSFPIGVTTTTLDGPVGARPRVSAIFTDISDSKRLEELHLRAERLEAVAELSSSLAHEIKNPLASIRSSVEQLGKSSRANSDEKFLANLIV